MHPPVNRYLVVAWITAALLLLSCGALITLGLIAGSLKPGGPSVPWTGLYLALMAVWALMPIVLRRPVLGVGLCFPAYAPRRRLLILAAIGSLMALFMLWSFMGFLSSTDNLTSAIDQLNAPLFLFAMWMWMLTITAFPAWHNDPAWGAGNDIVPSLPQLAGKLVRRLTAGRAST